MTIPMNGNWTRNDLAEALALRDGVVLQRINSTVGPEDDANNWRRYLGDADDVLAHLSLCAATNPPSHLSAVPDGEGELARVPRYGDALAWARQHLMSKPENQIVLAGEVAKAATGRFERKAVYNALTYMTKLGELRKAGYGQYDILPALAASRLSQAGVRVTDEMVERAARAMEPMAFREEFTATDEWFELEQEGRVQALGRARAALEAALSGDTP